ncbi:MAG: hypothetical protein U1A78_26915 [Polyangia bacterium]
MSACPSAPGGATVPASCEDDQILISASGQWYCSTPPAYRAPALPPPPCPSAPAGVLSSDGNSLSCSTADYGLGQTLSSTAASLDRLEGRITALSSPQPSGLFRGVTNELSSGAMVAPSGSSAATGLPAAAARCSAEYPGSHLCSVFELYDSVVRGKLTNDSLLPKSWIYFPAGNAAATAERPLDGIADSCAGYTYGLDDRGWSGIAAEWTVLLTGSIGFKFHGGSAAPCSASLPLACCGGAP